MDDKQILDLYINRSEKAIEETDAKYGSYCRIYEHSSKYSGQRRNGKRYLAESMEYNTSQNAESVKNIFG